MSAETIVSLHSEILPSGFIDVQVMVQGMPEKFLGMGFHVIAEGSDFSFEGYSLGNVLQNSEPLVLMRERDDAIIVGASLTRDQIKSDQATNLGDGVLLHMYLRPTELGSVTLKFDEGVVSTFENDQRFDLPEVRWANATVAVEKLVERSVAVGAEGELGDSTSAPIIATPEDTPLFFSEKLGNEASTQEAAPFQAQDGAASITADVPFGSVTILLFFSITILVVFLVGFLLLWRKYFWVKPLSPSNRPSPNTMKQDG